MGNLCSNDDYTPPTKALQSDEAAAAFDSGSSKAIASAPQPGWNQPVSGPSQAKEDSIYADMMRGKAAAADNDMADI